MQLPQSAKPTDPLASHAVSKGMCHFLKKYVVKTAVILFLAQWSANTAAEVITDSYACNLDAESRLIQLTFINEPDTLPCEIRVIKNSAASETLWRAENDINFCRQQFGQFRSKQESVGWSCETRLTSTPTTTTGATSGDTRPEAVIAGPATATATYPEQNSGLAQVMIVENRVSQKLLGHSPQVPSGKHGNLTADDIREMDDWLIYLSAQTMASIRELSAGTEIFSTYQKREALQATDIYQRLHHRIEFLNKLIAHTPASIELSKIDFFD